MFRPALTLACALVLSACGSQTQYMPTAYAPQQYGASYAQQGMYTNPMAYPQQQVNAMAYTQAATPLTSQATYNQTATAQATQTTQTAARAAQSVNTTRTPSQTVTQQRASSPTKTTQTTRRAPASPQLSTAQRLMQKAHARFDSLKSLKILVKGFETNLAKGPTNLTFTMTALNGQTKLEVLQHKNSLYKGVKMGYIGGVNNIEVRPGGALGFVKISTKMDDDRLLTPRGYRLDQIDAFAINERLLGGNHAPKVLGKTKVDGRDVAILEFSKVNDFDQKITRELLGIDMQDYFIRVHEMYEGSKMVFSLKISQVQLDAPVTAKDLEI